MAVSGDRTRLPQARGAVRYDLDDVEAWIEGERVDPAEAK